MDFLEKFSRPLYEGGKVGRTNWTIISCVEFCFVTYSAWNHDIPLLCEAFLLMCTCLYLAHSQIEKRDDDSHDHSSEPDPETPTGDAIDLWLKERVCSK